ncbi:hypothetical protein HDU91_001681, partial [Kappamyces sp. JEL0680]
LRELLMESLASSGIIELPLSEKELAWLDDACLKRYLRATRNELDNTVNRLVNTLVWRRDYKPDEISTDEIAEEAATGKEFVKGFCKEGRPILYLVPARENSKNYDRMMRFVVFNMELAIKLMAEGVEQMIIIVDYKNVSVMNAPPMSVSKRFLQIIGDHYPERLGISFVMYPTWYLWVFFKLLKPFIDPITIQKIHLVDPEADRKKASDELAKTGMGGAVSSVLQYVDEQQLLEEYGGAWKWDWDFDEYWSYVSSVLAGPVL